MKKNTLILFLVLINILLHAQNKPFPQNLNYACGFKPTNIKSAIIIAHYNSWKNKYLKECGKDKFRVEFGNPVGTTVSEGQGYGMVITAYMGDRVSFDKLYNFEKSMHNQYGNMGWKETCKDFDNSVGGSTSATDGDLDIAYSLCIASVQWGENFAQLAKDRIQVLKENNFTYDATFSRWIQEWRDGTTENNGNSSYWSPGYYRVFKDFTGDSDWDLIANDTYNLMLGVQNSLTGFVGNQIKVDMTNEQNLVDYNGARIPWRMVLDYIWTGNLKAKKFCDKLTDWANGKDIVNVVDGYLVDGTPTGHWNKSPAWTGAWACGAMSKSQTVVNTFTAHFNTCTHDEYFASTLRLLYELVLTGNYWRPSLGQATVYIQKY